MLYSKVGPTAIHAEELRSEGQRLRTECARIRSELVSVRAQTQQSIALSKLRRLEYGDSEQCDSLVNDSSSVDQLDCELAPPWASSSD